ncbi:alanine--tRNA ligase [Patescibacteria group bacterium]|nr:alanine--tRNA ligase [Patescibacteria group bacterium]
MTNKELRDKFIEFFESKKHVNIPSFSLIPENDPTCLFISAGMQPLIPYLAGEKHPEGNRLCNFQKCIRTNDIDEVGDDTHLTFFEMLGNWSLGDYFKEDSIKWSYEFLTSEKYLNLDKNYLAVTCYKGNKKYNIPKDTESYDLWVKNGISPKKMAFLGDDDNWWPKIDMNGLCGPDTEIFYWTGDSTPPLEFDPEDDNWVEIWNNVFMQYKFDNGKISELENKNVDTGMGLERVLCVVNNYNNIYESELFKDVILELEKLSGKLYKNFISQMRIIADHARTATFILSEKNKITPSNSDKGYILRRLIRKVVRLAKEIGIPENISITSNLAEIYIKKFKNIYPELLENKDFIISELKKEEDKFELTLDNGIKEFNKAVKILKNNNKKIIPGDVVFRLYDTYGFPFELTKNMAKIENLNISEEDFCNRFKKHQEVSKKGSDKKFKGGLADNNYETVKLHTTAHLLIEALRRVLGDHVFQRGANITQERLRFDFSHPNKLTEEEIEKIENLVNKKIKEKIPVICKEMCLDDAKKCGAMGIFDNKYGNNVKVYQIGDFSNEICGGPHVENTSELGVFKIKKQESSSAGVRRIKAVLLKE